MKNFMKSLLRNRTAAIYAVGIILFVISATLGLLLGSASIEPAELINALFSADKSSSVGRILWYVRIPRVIASLLCGGALALSGAVIQGVLSNSLASPSVIGVNSGAGLAVTVCASLGIMGGWRLSLFAFIGAFLTVLTVSIAARQFNASRGTVVLIGVAMNALLGAISDTVITFSPDIATYSFDFRVGDFSSVTFAKLNPALIIITLCSVLILTLSNELRALGLGEENARGIGLNTKTARLIFLILSAALAASAVSLAGLLSFVGLLIPHGVRRICRSAEHLLPLSLIFGAGFVTLCDTMARVVFTPYELPVGIIMAFLGAPFFIFILIKKRRGDL